MYAIELARSIDLFDDSLTASVPPTLSGALSSRVDAVPDSMRECAVRRRRARSGHRADDRPRRRVLPTRSISWRLPSPMTS